jgi:hypothetical protein
MLRKNKYGYVANLSSRTEAQTAISQTEERIEMFTTFHFANAVKAASLALAVGLGVTSVAHADEYERWIFVYNSGSSEIVDIRMISVYDPVLSPNLLFGAYIGAGEDMIVEPLDDEGYCFFDVLIEYADGSEVALWEVDLCTATSVTVDEWDYEISYM